MQNIINIANHIILYFCIIILYQKSQLHTFSARDIESIIITGNYFFVYFDNVYTEFHSFDIHVYKQHKTKITCKRRFVKYILYEILFVNVHKYEKYIDLQKHIDIQYKYISASSRVQISLSTFKYFGNHHFIKYF